MKERQDPHGGEGSYISRLLKIVTNHYGRTFRYERGGRYNRVDEPMHGIGGRWNRKGLFECVVRSWGNPSIRLGWYDGNRAWSEGWTRIRRAFLPILQSNRFCLILPDRKAFSVRRFRHFASGWMLFSLHASGKLRKCLLHWRDVDDAN